MLIARSVLEVNHAILQERTEDAVNRTKEKNGCFYHVEIPTLIRPSKMRNHVIIFP